MGNNNEIQSSKIDSDFQTPTKSLKKSFRSLKRPKKKVTKKFKPERMTPSNPKVKNKTYLSKKRRNSIRSFVTNANEGKIDEMKKIINDDKLTINELVKDDVGSKFVLDNLKGHKRSDSLFKHTDIVEKLLSSSEEDNRWGFWTLYYICESNHAYKEELLDKLVSMKDVDINEPFLEACCQGYFKIIKLLLENGADIEYKDEVGDTCLHYVGRLILNPNQKEIIEYLLKMGANPLAKNKLDETVFDYVIDEDIIKILNKYKTVVRRERRVYSRCEKIPIFSLNQIENMRV